MQALQHDHLLLPDGTCQAIAHRGTQSDIAVLRQVFAEQHYSFTGLSRGAELRSLYGAMTAAGKTPLIIDAGANIGASAVYFSASFPLARIIAIEPHAQNFALLCQNTKGRNVDCRLAAIGSEAGFAEVEDNGFGEWGYQTARRDNAACPILPMQSLVDEALAQGFAPFFAKIDIEGAEADLFACATAWVKRFPLLSVELHDRMHPGKAISRNFLRCIAQEDRDFLYPHHNVFSISNEMR